MEKRDFTVELHAARDAQDWDAHSRIWDERCAAEVDHDEAQLTYPTIANVVQPGVTFRQNSASGIYVSRVLRQIQDTRRSTHGYWETVILEGGHPALLNSIQIVSTATIYKARAGRGAEWAGKPFEMEA